MKKFIMVVAVLLCMLLLCSCEKEESDMIKVETPYCELTLPEEFAGNVEYRVVSEDPYTVEFTAKDGTKLFSLLFNGETENLIGTIVGEDENTVIYAEFAELDETDSKYMEYGQYQSGINTIIEHYEITVNGKRAQAVKTRVSAMPFNRYWPGKQRSLEQTEFASYISISTDERICRV